MARRKRITVRREVVSSGLTERENTMTIREAIIAECAKFGFRPEDAQLEHLVRELTTVATKFDALQAERDDLRAKLDAVEKERNDLRQQLRSIQALTDPK